MKKNFYKDILFALWIPAKRSCIEILRSISIFKLMKVLTSMRFLNFRKSTRLYP